MKLVPQYVINPLQKYDYIIFTELCETHLLKITVDSTVISLPFPFPEFDGEKVFLYQQKCIYENVKGNWIVKHCNRTCLPIYLVAIINEGLVVKL